MRTRLDEIVEEEIKRGPFGVVSIAVGERIAERAFRHGVEQEYKAPKIFDWYAEGNEMRVRVKSQHAVQPAPVTEHDVPHRASKKVTQAVFREPGTHHTYAQPAVAEVADDVVGVPRWCCNKAEGVTLVADPPPGFYPCGCPTFVYRKGDVNGNTYAANESRRGERRKAFTETRWIEGIGQYWFGKGYRDAGPERRSGKDRRRG